jgi:hypothetical protein
LYGGEYVLAVDGLSLLILALLTGLTRDEGYKLGDALLDSLLGVLGDFSIIRQGLFHDPADIGNWQEPGVIG